MSLEDVIKAATIPKIEYVEKEVTWKENTFIVSIKSAETPADFEFVYLNKRTEEDALMARRVHRFVLFDGEQMPYEKASKLRWDFLTALCSAINHVQGPGSDEEKKH